jgi:hypothetical protein
MRYLNLIKIFLLSTDKENTQEYIGKNTIMNRILNDHIRSFVGLIKKR